MNFIIAFVYVNHINTYNKKYIQKPIYYVMYNFWKNK